MCEGFSWCPRAGTPKDGWGAVPGAMYEHCVKVRLANGKLIQDGATTATADARRPAGEGHR